MNATAVPVEGPSDAAVLEVLARRLGLDSPKVSVVHDQLHRFAGTRSGRKVRLAAALAEELSLDAVPAPLRRVLAYAAPSR